jgi:hypothetical protein
VADKRYAPTGANDYKKPAPFKGAGFFCLMESLNDIGFF